MPIDLSGESRKKDIEFGNVPEDGTLLFQEEKIDEKTFERIQRKKSVTHDKLVSLHVDVDDHYLTLAELDTRYNVRLDVDSPWKSFGHTDIRAKELLKLHGFNRLTPPKKHHPITLFLHEFKNPLTILLFLAGILAFVLYAIDTKILENLYLGAVLIVVTLLNALIEFAQLQKAAAILDSFKNLIPQSAFVIRDGNQQIVPNEEIVKGDLIYIKEGDKVPADVRVVYASNFKVDNSSLTGESDPQQRFREPQKGLTRVVEATNLAFGGTTVVSGEAYAIVIRCGDHTVLGEIAGMTTIEKRKSPLTQEIDRLVKFISIASGILALIFFAIGMAISPSFSRNFNFLIGIFCANIPQGLPVTVTLLLSFAVKRMANKNVVVKDLQAVDTLGSITLLASDKTGTMTQNKMTVVHGWLNGNHYDMLQTPSDADHASDFDINKTPGAKSFVDTCYICNKAKFDTSTDNLKLDIPTRKVFGDATETGLLKFAAHYLEMEVIRGIDDIKVFEVPFNSTNKWALTIVSSNIDDDSLTVYMKGAPERVFAKCSFIYDHGQQRSIHDSDRTKFEQAYELMASMGQRVLALAYRSLPSCYDRSIPFSLDPPYYPSDELTFLGLVGLMDPPKDRVAEAVKACRAAHIQVMMITGDHPFTAEAIARKVGLVTGDTIEQVAEKSGKPIALIQDHEYDVVVVHGDKIDSMTNIEWESVLRKKEIVFARTSPIHKLEIVARCQAMGHIVGVTGDGVNDSPALKKADLGISMGISGSDISKEVAGMILLDDNFATIVDGIKEGRLIFENLKKCLRYILTHIASEIWPFIFYIALGLPLALSSLQILMIDLGSELPPALSFSYEGAEDDIMSKMPRNQVIRVKEAPIVSSEDARNLSQVPSFVVESSVETDVKGKRWQKFSCSYDKEKNVKLVDRELLSWSYLQGGTIETLAGFGGFFWIFASHGIGFSSLWGLARPGRAYGADIVTDAYVGDVSFTGSQLSDILSEAQTAYFVSIILVQYFVLYVCRASSGYPCGKRMLQNRLAYFSFLFSFGWAMFCAYVPFMNKVIGTRPLTSYEGYIPALIGGFTLIVYEFVRRWLFLGLRRLSSKRTLQKFEAIALIQPRPSLTRSLSLNKAMKREFFASEFMNQDNFFSVEKTANRRF